MVPSITESAINIAIGDMLQAMLPQFAPGQIIVGQTNRVASPEGDYIVFWPLRRPRLGTDIETPTDAVFTGTITPIDANATTFASVVAGSGSNKIPVYDDGTNWRIG